LEDNSNSALNSNPQSVLNSFDIVEKQLRFYGIRAIILVVLIWIVFFGFSVFLLENPQLNHIGDSFNIISSLVSGLALAAIALSFYLERADFRVSLKEISDAAKAQTQIAEETRKAREERTADFYRRFSESSLREARTFVWRSVMANWFSSPEYRKILAYYGDDENIKEVQPLVLDGKTIGGDDIQKALYLTSDLIDFYVHLFRVIGDDEKLLSSLANQYFYHWWRGFLLSYALVCEKAWLEKCSTIDEKNQLPFHDNLRAILLFDRRCMTVPFIARNHVVYSRLNSGLDVYPNLKEHNSHFDAKVLAQGWEMMSRSGSA